jgi:hypothetical protein
MYLVLAVHHPAALPIKRYAGGTDDFPVIVIRPYATQEGAYSRKKLANHKRLYQKIVCARIQTTEPLFDVLHQCDRRQECLTIGCSQPNQQIGLLGRWKYRVENYQVRNIPPEAECHPSAKMFCFYLSYYDVYVSTHV